MIRFDPSILAPNPAVRTRLCAILDAALDAVRPDAAVLAQFRRAGDVLTVGDRTYDLNAFRRIVVLGAGKAGAPMAQAVEQVLGDRISAGLVVVKEGHGGPTQHIEIVEAGHPVPTQAALAAGQRVLALAQAVGPDDLVIVLLSGGGSALLEALDGVTLADLRSLTGALLACGATIGEINCLRKHLSLIKGGNLARAVALAGGPTAAPTTALAGSPTAATATLLTLVLSDVVGSPLDVIASGPTVPDPTTWADAWAIVTKYGLEPHLPAGVTARLRAGVAGDLPDTPKPGDPAFARAQVVIVGDNRVAAQAACAQAAALGYAPLLLSTFVEGEARTVAQLLVALAREVRATGHPVPAPACLVLGGETTVTLGDNPGLGGRNQEVALAAALALVDLPGVTVAALATDGSDGPTNSAGGLADAGTVARGAALGRSAAGALQRHDAWPYLAAVGDLLRTGPTQTNVNDLLVVLVEAG